MLKSLFGTSLDVRDIDRSAAFYCGLGLPLAWIDPEKTAACLWIGSPGAQVLGLRLAPPDRPFAPRSLAFGVEMEDLLSARAWLAERGIEPCGAFGRDGSEPIVHAWMPAAALFFRDPDGNEVELCCMLPDEPHLLPPTPSLSEWQVAACAPKD